MNGVTMTSKPFVHEKVLVVGTTSDYIDWIRNSCPGQALFLTRPQIRTGAEEPAPATSEEILVELEDISLVTDRLKQHLAQWNQKIAGVACFDCESMETASQLADQFGQEYPGLQSIRNCRDKLVCKEIWNENHIRCPRTRPVNSQADAQQFLAQFSNGIVLKPFCGSGSELVFRVTTAKECAKAFKTIEKGLKKRSANPLFRRNPSQPNLMLAEEFFSGPEYSCDFIIEDNRVRIIRMARKIKPVNRPFGTVSGYILPAALPSHIPMATLEHALLEGARSLGITRAICMVDFIIGEHAPVLIEMTPRPGGDCLPFLLKAAGNLDMLALTLDFAAHRPLPINGSVPFLPHIGIRIHAQKSGVFKGFKADLLADDKRVKDIHMIRKPGHKITMPPDDYDSWLLGHMIIDPGEAGYPETLSDLIRRRLILEIE